MPDRDLCFTPATELARLYRARKAAALDVMQAVLARIDAVKPRVNGYVTVARESALAAARRATAALRRGAALPSLPAGFTRDGLPVGIQIVGRRRHEAAAPWADRIPPVVAGAA